MNKVYLTLSGLQRISGILYNPKDNTPEKYFTYIIGTFLERRRITGLSIKDTEKIANVLHIAKLLDSSFDLHALKIEEQKRRDKVRLIFTKELPSYHLNHQCKTLTHDYRNYTIPIEIPDEKINEYRAFFKANEQIYINQPELFFTLIEKSFSITLSPSSIQKMAFHNSGSTQLQLEMDLGNELPDKISSIEHFFTENKRYIQMFGMVYDEEKLKEKIESFLQTQKGKRIEKNLMEILYILDRWKTYKNYLIKEIICFIAETNNININYFNSEALDALGIPACKVCSAYR